jgi:hypothetical protein
MYVESWWLGGRGAYFDGRFALAVMSNLQGSYCEVANGVDLAVCGRGGAGCDTFLDGLGEACGCEEQGSEESRGTHCDCSVLVA